MRSKKEFEAALRDIKNEVMSHMEQLRDIKKTFEEQIKRKRRSKLISGHLNSSSASSPARKGQKKKRN